MTCPARHLLLLDNLSVHIPVPGGILRAVDGVSLSLEPGKTLAIVGESGCGKSMLCRAIMGILPGAAAVGGRIVFAGEDLRTLSEKGLNGIRGRRIGIVLQDPMSSLNPVIKIGQQIAEPMRHHLRMPAAGAMERAVSLLDSVGIPQPAQRVDCYPHQLSGGMRQRVAIAIALACDPQLLIADEPTTALDVTVQAEILNLLGRLQKERNMGMILVTHDLGVVAGRAHDTAVMYAGRIVEQAQTPELFDRMRMPYTRALFDSVPRLDDPPNRVLPAIDGQPPDLAALPPGCRFAPRCMRAQERCRVEEPSLVENGREDHRYACWFPCIPPSP
ncbi:MAG: peptide/nickel transport system ATP-binding [Geobacteraceae bacterium]|nr:MAG: peptide/nickel transport system ATP-binding [Geobacteraceae bacterium]